MPGHLGAVSLKKSHDIIILSFCNIVKGQANYLKETWNVLYCAKIPAETKKVDKKCPESLRVPTGGRVLQQLIVSN